VIPEVVAMFSRYVGALATVALVAAACGGSSGSSGSGPGTAGSSGSSTVTWPTADQEAASSGVFSLPTCGSKPVTLAILDGFGINAWSQESYAAARSEAAKCSNVRVLVSAGGGDLQKSISDINSAVAQGAKAMVVIPDFGQAELDAISAATAAGVRVVPWGADPSGTAGKDYVAYVDWDPHASGVRWANWMVEALHGTGNVVYTGGPAGNPVGAEQLKGVAEVFASHPGMKLLTGTTSWPVTNWDPATAQKATAALLASYPQIDGIISNYGTDALASIRAFQAASRTAPPITTLDANGLSCLYKQNGVSLSTISSRNWMGRIAVRKAIAAAEGLPNAEPTSIDLPFFEDTLHGRALQCSTSSAPDFYPSNRLTVDDIARYGKP
jgi:ribose transport system substrate-binding protein